MDRLLSVKHDLRAARCRPILRGFTLVELVMVLLILAIMASIAVPRFTRTRIRYRVDAAANRVANDLNLARRHAHLSSAAQSVSFDVAADSYTLTGLADPDHPTAEYEVHLDQSPYEVGINSADFDGDVEIIFDGYGMPDSGGTVVVGLGAEQRIVSLDPDTGQVSVSTIVVVGNPGP